MVDPDGAALAARRPQGQAAAAATSETAPLQPAAGTSARLTAQAMPVGTALAAPVQSGEALAAAAPAPDVAVNALSDAGAPIGPAATTGRPAPPVAAPGRPAQAVNAAAVPVATVAPPATAAPRVTGADARLPPALAAAVEAAPLAPPGATAVAVLAPEVNAAAERPATGTASGVLSPSAGLALAARPALATHAAPRPPAARPAAAFRPQGGRAAPQSAAGMHKAPATPAAPAARQQAAGEVASDLQDTLPEATLTKAALAWTGDEGEVDPASLAAIQAFLRPGDAPEGENVRDAVGRLLASVPCSRLQTTFVPETGKLELRGHIPEEGLRQPVLDALSQRIGPDIPVADNLLILPRPQCGALAGIASAGLPQSDEQTSNPRIVGPNTHARVYAFREGDRLAFDLQGADYPAFFYIDYFDAEGSVLHLRPNELVPLEKIGPAEQVVIGRPRDGKPALNITVTPPFGQEILVAFATSHRLYEGLRSTREPAEGYLKDLQRLVAEARAAHPDFKGEWVYFFVRTGA